MYIINFKCESVKKTLEELDKHIKRGTDYKITRISKFNDLYILIKCEEDLNYLKLIFPEKFITTTSYEYRWNLYSTEMCLEVYFSAAKKRTSSKEQKEREWIKLRKILKGLENKRRKVLDSEEEYFTFFGDIEELLSAMYVLDKEKTVFYFFISGLKS